MKIALLTPDWPLPWIRGLHDMGEAMEHHFLVSHEPEDQPVFVDKADVVIHGWANGFSDPNHYPNAVNIMFLRRFELFDNSFLDIPWVKVDHLIFVNDWIRDVVVNVLFAKAGFTTPTSVIYNAVDPTKWTYKPNRPRSHRIGMACYVNQKKNLPMALQILLGLPHDYSLHIAGGVQDPCTAEYLNHVAKACKRKLYIYGQIQESEMDTWWEQMEVCLSTSISEGNPNNVNEAMMKGIKPVVHTWPGAKYQYPEDCLFRTVDEAIAIIQSSGYNALKYHDWAFKKFSPSNWRQVIELAEQLVESKR